MSSGSGARVAVVIWLLAAASVVVGAAFAGYDPFDSRTWSRWDSALYLDIAEDGYDLYACRPPENVGLEGWCGDAGWFPAYPWIVRGLHEIGLPLRGAAVVLSWLLAGATLVLLWATFLRRETGRTLAAALLYAAFAPGMIYGYGAFPMSLLSLAIVACLWLLHRGRWFLAGWTGAVAVLAHPLGALLVPVSAIWLLAERSPPLRERLRRIVLTSGPMLAALALLAIIQWAETGRWNAYLLVQEKYGHRLREPTTAVWDALTVPDWPSIGGGRAVSVQMAFVLVTVAAVVVHALALRRALTRLHGLILLWTAAALIVPLAQSGVALQRSHAALLPVVVLVAQLPTRVLYPLAIAAVPIAAIMEHAFLYGSVV